jgi:hypothetical protein
VTSFSDPAFASNKTLPVHRWVPWIAGFSSDFVRQALEKHLDRKGTVLDPFAGVGTTLIESIRLGHMEQQEELLAIYKQFLWSPSCLSARNVDQPVFSDTTLARVLAASERRTGLAPIRCLAPTHDLASASLKAHLHSVWRPHPS